MIQVNTVGRVYFGMPSFMGYYRQRRVEPKEEGCISIWLHIPPFIDNVILKGLEAIRDEYGDWIVSVERVISHIEKEGGKYDTF